MSDGTRGRAKRVVAPRGRGRRTQQDRAALLQAETERARERQAEYEKEQRHIRAEAERAERAKQRLESRGNRRGGPGRGGFMGESRSAIPSGPFGAGSVLQDRSEGRKAFPRPWAPSKRGTTGAAKSFGSRIKAEGGEGAASGAGRDTGVDVDSGMDEEDEDRVNVDFIDLVSDDDEDGYVVAPVRVSRVDHVDRAPQVNPDAAVKKQEEEVVDLSSIPTAPADKKGKQRAKDVEVVSSQRRWQGVYEEEGEDDFVKEEPDAEDSVPVSAIPAVTSTQIGDRPASPTTTRNRTRKLTQPPPHFLTDDEKAEWERRQKGLGLLVEELSQVGLDKSKQAPPAEAATEEAQAEGTQAEGVPAESTATEGEQGEAAKAQEQAQPVDAKEDRVYLFQFPPVVPDLLDIEALREKELSEQASAEAQNSGGAVADPITVKEEHAPKVDLFAERPKHLPKLATGKVGKLRVHESGKATLDWGGTSLQLDMGVTPHFLQDSLMVKLNQPNPAATKDSIAGEAMAFGQVRGKFVVMPDWDEIVGKF